MSKQKKHKKKGDTRLLTDPMTFLPQRAAESIFKFLPIEDILSCCLVRSTWREAINTDNIWTRFCNLRINLESVRSVVNGGFHYPQTENLTPICANRQKYMREICLKNNFKCNRYVEYKIKMNRVRIPSSIDFLNNYRYLILNSIDGTLSANSFEVWDMEHERAPFYVQTISHLLTQTIKDTFQSLGDYLLIIQGNLFQIYTMVEGKLFLKCCRIFNREETFSQTIPANEDIASWYSQNNSSVMPGFKSEIADVIVLGKSLFGVFRSLLRNVHLNASVMHIWDWESGNKVKIERLPEVPEIIDTINFSGNSEYLYLAVRYQTPGGLQCKIYSYDVSGFQYTRFYFVYDHIINMMVTEKEVIVFHQVIHNRNKYFILDSVTGNVTAQKELEHPINPKLLTSYKCVMAIASGDTATIVDLVTQDEVAVLKFNSEPTRIFILESNFLIAVRSSNVSFWEVWDIKNKCKLFRMKNSLLILCERTFLRICVSRHNKMHVLNYW